MLDFLLSTLEQGLLYGVMVLGVYITYKILDFPDLTVDGSFPLGGAVAATLIAMKVNPILASLAAIGAGMIAGAVTGLLHVKLKITSLLSGILVMIGLYSVNLRIMGKSNIPLFNETTLFSSSIKPLIIIVIIVIAIKILLDLFLKTKMGYTVKAVGDNPQVVTSLGVNIGSTEIIALMLSNGLVALSGALVVQYQGYSDVGLGAGTIVTGLASVILGIALFKKISFMKATTMALIGSFLYKLSIAGAMKLGFPPMDLKLITVVIVIIALGINNTKYSFKSLFVKGGNSDASDSKYNKSVQQENC